MPRLPTVLWPELSEAEINPLGAATVVVTIVLVVDDTVLVTVTVVVLDSVIVE